MPMNTMLVGFSSGFAQHDLAHLARDLERREVAPESHAAGGAEGAPRAQPAWDEMQSVRRLPDGISTDSIASPSSSRQRYFRVPSADCWMVSGCQPGQGKTSVQLGSELRGSSVPRSQLLDRRCPEPPVDLAGPVGGSPRSPTQRARVVGRRPGRGRAGSQVR